MMFDTWSSQKLSAAGHLLQCLVQCAMLQNDVLIQSTVQDFQDQGQQEYHIDTGTFFTDNAPSWSELAELVERRMQETGKQSHMCLLLFCGRLSGMLAFSET